MVWRKVVEAKKPSINKKEESTNRQFNPPRPDSGRDETDMLSMRCVPGPSVLHPPDSVPYNAAAPSPWERGK